MPEGMGGRRSSPIEEFESNLFSTPVVVNGQTMQPVQTQPQRRTVADAAADVANLTADAAQAIAARNARIADAEARLREAEVTQRLEDMEDDREERRRQRRMGMQPQQDTGLAVIVPILTSLLERDRQPVQTLTADDVARVVDERVRQATQAPQPIDMLRGAFEVMREVTAMQPQVQAPTGDSPVILQMRHDQLMAQQRFEDERDERRAMRELEAEKVRQEAAGRDAMVSRLDFVFTDIVPKVMEMVGTQGGGGGAAPAAPRRAEAQPLVPDAVYSNDLAVFRCENCDHEVYAQISLGEQVTACTTCGQQYNWKPQNDN